MKEGNLKLRIMVNNDSIVNRSDGPQKGSVLDVDGWFEALDFDWEDNCLERLDEAHQTIKKLFFSLLKEDFLRSLNPVYQ
jgi:uncharacterized protein (TIGR04255 family)